MPKSKAKMPKRRQIKRAQNPKLARDVRRVGAVSGAVSSAASGRAKANLPAWQLQPDFGTRERWQHGARTLVSVATGVVAARALEECVLDSLQVAGQISPKLYVSGLQLRRDFVRAGLAPRQCSKYAPGTGEKVQYREFSRSAGQDESYQRWRTALLAAGVHYSDMLVNVCCLGWPPRAEDLPHLQEGLLRLYNHYAAQLILARAP